LTAVFFFKKIPLFKAFSTVGPYISWRFIMELLSPLWDYVFKHIFGDQRNIDILSAFIKDVLALPDPEFDRLTIVDPFLKKLMKRDKSGILDVKVHTSGGKIIDVEVQIEKYSGIKNRILYYRSKLIWEQLKAGDDYEKLNQVIIIAICDHVLLPEEKACENSYHLRNDRTNGVFTEQEHIIILELPKLTWEAKEKVELWMKFLKGGSLEEMEMLGKQDEAIGKAVGGRDTGEVAQRRQEAGGSGEQRVICGAGKEAAGVSGDRVPDGIVCGVDFTPSGRHR
jgi:predicted transposase/invertase (TIGR01784 family)